jgi:hypothetical protein
VDFEQADKIAKLQLGRGKHGVLSPMNYIVIIQIYLQTIPLKHKYLMCEILFFRRAKDANHQVKMNKY